MKILSVFFITALLVACVKKDDVRMEYLNALKDNGQVKKIIVREDSFYVEMWDRK